MRFAKLINFRLVSAPNPVLVGENRIGNPLGEVYLAEGWKPVTFTDPPSVEAGYRPVESWTETDEAIVQGWTVEEVTELDGEEAMQMLFGGDEHVE